MKTLALIALLCLTLLIGFLVVRAQTQEASWGVSSGTHRAESQEQAQAFENRFDEWLEDHGFVPSSQAPSWSGVHAEDMEYMVYEGSYQNIEPVFLELRKTKFDYGESQQTQFSFYSRWSVMGSKEELRKTEQASDDFVTSFSYFVEVDF